MKIYTIYVAKNIITNKCYVGFTSTTLDKRKSRHKNKALKNSNKNKFYSAITEYGWDSFEWFELYQAKENIPFYESHTLTVMENFFIQQFDSINNGYNTQPGGNKYPILEGSNNPMFGKKHSSRSIELMKANRKDNSGEKNPMHGVKRTEEWLNSNLRGKNHPMYGKKHKPESINLIVGKRIECEHCGKLSNKGNYNRWHGSRCKKAS